MAGPRVWKRLWTAAWNHLVRPPRSAVRASRHASAPWNDAYRRSNRDSTDGCGSRDGMLCLATMATAGELEVHMR